MIESLIDICAEACRLSYDETVIGFDVEDLRYIVQNVNGIKLIAFRGTAEAGNVIRDIEILPEDTPAGHHGHGGFVGAFRTLLNSGVMLHMEENTVFTGHSLGGAIAVLFAELTGHPVITFGCPKVYTKWGTSPTLNHVRITLDDDPVPMLPAVLYKHDCDPVTLFRTPTDEGIDISDHFIDSYIKYLDNRKESSHGN
jgi:hypothetical protein